MEGTFHTGMVAVEDNSEVLEDSTRPVVAQYYKSLVDWEAFENKQEAFQLFLSLLHVKVAAFLAEREEN